MTRVLIAGVSTRAAAQSAARTGLDVTSVDAFGDLDQPAGARVIALDERFTAAAVARRARDLEADAVSYVSNLENHPNAVARLAHGRVLWGNAPGVLVRVRDPAALARAFRDAGVPFPAIPRTATRGGRWLVKPRASGGGRRIRMWDGRRRVPSSDHLQEFLDGTPGSVVFAAASGRAVPLGVSRQLVGDARFGGSGFRYCGSILAPADDPQFEDGPTLVDAAGHLAEVAAAAFGLVGLNGVDFIARRGQPVPIEINPRWSSSMELIEQADGRSLFAAHAAACARGELPATAPAPVSHAYGKAIVYSRARIDVPDTGAWCADTSVADIPRPGSRVGAGSPICTVFAEAATGAACEAALARRAAEVYAELAGRTPAAVTT